MVSAKADSSPVKSVAGLLGGLYQRSRAGDSAAASTPCRVSSAGRAT